MATKSDAPTNVGDNVELKVAGDRLTITIDLAKRFGKSSTGKSTTIATTKGFTKLTGKHEKVFLSLNCGTKE